MKTTPLRQLVFSLGLLVAGLVSPADAATISWTNINGGDWTAAANWSPHQVPGGGDTAIIAGPGAYTVTVDASLSVGSLTLGGAGGQQTLSTAGHTLTLNHASTFDTNTVLALNGGALFGGPLTANGQIVWTGGVLGSGQAAIMISTNGALVLAGTNGGSYSLGQPLTSAGGIYLQSGNLVINWCGSGYGGLVNLPGGLVDLMGDVSINQNCGGPGFVNQGTLLKSGGGGTSAISQPFSSSGTVEANVGVISLNGATLSSGSLFIGTGQTVLSGGTVNFSGSLTSSNLVLAGATLQGNGVINGLLTWSSGTLGAENSALTIATNATVVLSGVDGVGYSLGQVVTNMGVIRLQSGDLTLNWCGGNYGGLVNLPGGLVELMADVAINNSCGGPGFVNLGKLVKSGGTGSSTVAGPFSNSGAVEANTGNISLNGATLNDGSTYAGAGQVLLSGGTVNLNGSLTSSNLVLAGATLQARGVLNGSLTWLSGVLGTGIEALTIATNSVLVLAGVSGSNYSLGQYLTNAGTILLQSGNLEINWCAEGVLVNLPGAVLDLAGDVSIVACSGGPGLINQGTLVKSAGVGTSVIATPFNNSGMVEADTGVISLNGPSASLTGSLFLGAGRTLLSGGAVNWNGSLTSSNLVLAGATVQANGVLNGLLTWTSGALGTGTSGLTIAPGSVLVLAGGNGTNYSMGQYLTNAGTIRLQSGNLMVNWCQEGVLVNLPRGVLDLAGDVSIVACSGGPGLINEGTLLKSAGTGTSTLSTPFHNVSGSVAVNSGTLSLGGSSYAQGGGALTVTLGGTNSGQSGELSGIGAASLGGLLSVDLSNGFVPTPGTTFQILSGASRSGTAGPLNVPAGLSVSYSNNGIFLTATGSIALQPAITVQPTNQAVPYAGTVTFGAVATGMLPLTYQWQANGAHLSDGGEVSGSATPTLRLSNVTDNDARNYSLVVSNVYGAVTSTAARLVVVNCIAPPEGAVAWWPANGSALDTIGGNNGTLQGGVTFATGEVGQAFDFDGTSGYVSVPHSPLWDFGTNDFTIEFWAEFKGASGAQSFIACDDGGGYINKWVLFYGYVVGGLTFHLNGEPGSQTIGNFPFSPSPGQWYHLALARGGPAWTFYVNGSAIGTAMNSVAVPSMTAPLTIGEAEGQFHFNGLMDEVSIYNRALSGGEIAAIYGAGSGGKCVTAAPAIIGQPLSQSVVVGDTATLSVATTGALPMEYQWQINGTTLSDGGRLSGARSDLLTITNVQFSDGGAYTVTATNVVGGTISLPAILTVVRKTPIITWTNPLAITYGTAINNTQLNASANVPGSFAYNPPPGAILDAGSYLLRVAFTPTDTVNYRSLTGSVSLVVSPAPLTVAATSTSRAYGTPNPGFAGNLTGLQGLDRVGAAYDCAASLASPPGLYPIVPRLLDPFGRLRNYSVTAYNGGLTVNAAAAPTLLSIFPNTGSTNGGQTVTITGTDFEIGAGVSFGSAPAPVVIVNSPTSLTAVTPASAQGLVGVSLLNPDGNPASLANAFTFGVPPSIQVQPLSQAVVLGSNVQFQVQASGAGALGYQWQFNGANLLNLPGITGVHTPTLSLTGLVAADGGSYQVVISNPFGVLTSTGAVLTVLTAPTVSAPQSVAVGVGGSASFSVTAGGTAPYTYQWYQGGNPLTGATSPTLTLPSVQATNQGQYSVVVSNRVSGVTSPSATLTVLGYCASASATRSAYPAGAVVPLTVKTVNCGSSSAVTNGSAVLWIYGGGTTRSTPVTTGISGSTDVNFTPLAGEVGLVQFAAALPGQSPPPPQGSFTLLGLGMTPASLTTVLTAGQPQTFTVTLTNLTGVPLSGLTASVLGAPADLSAQVSVPATLAGNGSVQASCTLQATGVNPGYAQFTLQFTTAEGVSNTVPVHATLAQLQPRMVATPAGLSGTMVGGEQTLVSFGLANLGGAPSGTMQVEVPAGAPWLSVVTAQPMPSLAPGQTNQVTLALTPTNTLTLGDYSGSIIIDGASFQVPVPFTFDCVSTQTGDLQVTVQDEFTLVSPGAPEVTNATVTVSDFLSGTNVATAVTGSNGVVLFTNLTSAYYKVDVSAPDHGSFSTALLVAPNRTNHVTAFLTVDLVSYTWVVTPTEIPDNYDFTLTTTFQTQVPWPVVTISPGAFNLCAFGGTNQVNLVITNSGLIAAQGLQLSFGTNQNWSIVPLASFLGDLPAESSVVVPVVITQLGASTAAPSSMAAELDWHVFTPTQTNYYATPIYVYNANPNDCVISSTPVVNVTGGGGGGGGGDDGFVGGGGGGGSGPTPTPYVAPPSYSFVPPVTGAIVDVTLQIDQHAVIMRDAFKATLQLNNNAAAPITDLEVTINPVDAAGNPAPGMFEIVPPTLSGINAVDGTGSMATGTSGTASWIIIPTTNAAPAGPTQFAIGGTLSYRLNGEPVVIPLFPVPITVLPSPILSVDYFLEHDVYSQDPFVSQPEPSVPFGLGILVHNSGLGTARDFTITSAQPRIIGNSNGLLIDFQLIGSQAGTNVAVSPSLTMDLGAIQPDGNAVGIWLMTSTLEGAFVSYSATFRHVDSLGATNTSLVDSVKIHEMNHIVRITVPSDDGLPDFLVNDSTNVDALPNNLYSSAGPVFPVTSLSNVTVVGTPSLTQSNVTMSVSAPPGWVYLEFPDPSAGTMAIATVQRSDGVNLLVGPNVWQTPERIHMIPPQPRSLVHLLDYNSTGSYTLTYGATVNPPSVTTLAGVATNNVAAILNALVNPNHGVTTVYFRWGNTTNYDNQTPNVLLSQGLDVLQDASYYLVGLRPNTTYHYQAVAYNSAGTVVGADVSFTTPLVPLPVITPVGSSVMAVGSTLAITNHADSPVIFSLDPNDPAGCFITPDGIFTWTPTCEQGSTTNLITIWANVIQNPATSNSLTFTVIVGECAQVGLGSVVVQTGQGACVPVNLLSPLALSDLRMTLRFPTNRLGTWSISSTNLVVGAAILQTSTPSEIQFELTALPGRSFQGPATLAELCFQALGTHSAFVPLTVANLTATDTSGQPVGNASGIPGLVTVVAAEPLLQAGLGSNAMPVITLYGAPGANYVVQSAPSPAGSNWQTVFSFRLTNVVQLLFGTNPPNTQFYRAYKQGP